MPTIRLSIFFYLFFSTLLQAQNLQSARFVIDTLSSSAFKGRGASGSGDSLASLWLQQQYTEIGLSKIENTFTQNFQYPINTYPSTVKMSIGKQILQCGKDFIIRPESQSINGEFTLCKLDTLNISRFIKKRKKDQIALIVDANWWNNHRKDADRIEIQKQYPLIIIKQRGKFTASLSTQQVNYTHVEVSDSLIDKLKSKMIKINIECQLQKNHQADNVFGYVKGSIYPDSFLVVSAHYDHLGLMGSNTYFPGANDNASGVAMLLELAKYYAIHQPKYSILFIAFTAEEAGLIGSKYFVKNSPVGLSKIKFVVNLDMVGTGEAGIAVVNATVYENKFSIIDSINKSNKYFVNIKKRGKAANSDHYSFTEANVPAFFMYTMGGIQAYHDINDVSETLPLSHFTQVFELVHQYFDTF